MKKILKRKTLFTVLMCFIWLGIIFYNGTRQGEISQRSSKEIIEIISNVMNIPPSTINKLGIKLSDINYFVKEKCAFLLISCSWYIYVLCIKAF